jgi:hypothetical protein
MFCIMRTEKRKRTDITGIQKENNRTATGYNNSVNRERSELNVPLIQSNNWTQDIKAEIDRAGAHTRSNSVVALDTLYTASPQFFDDKTQEQTEHFFKECLQFHQERFGHIISAVIHYDETTPHLHVVSVPLTQDGRLSARDVIGNRAKMSRTQDMFYEQVGKVYGLDRGERGDGQEKKEHTSAQEHKLREVKANKERELEELDAIKSSKSHARARAEKWRQKAYEQEGKNWQAEIDKQRLQSQIEAERAVLQNVTAERERVEKQVKQLQGFLTLAEQRQLEETIYTDRDSERF